MSERWASELTACFQTILQLSYMAGLLAVLIFLIKALFKNRLSPHWHYAIWIILLLRLVIPWSPEASFSLFNALPSLHGTSLFQDIQPYAEQQPDEELLSGQTATVDATAEAAIPTAETPEAAGPGSEAPSPTNSANSSSASSSSPGYMLVLALIWAVGFAALAIGSIRNYWRYSRFVKSQPALQEPSITRLFEECQSMMGVKRPIRLLESDAIASPTLIGIVRPKLIMPSGAISALQGEQLRYIFLHELSHAKRNDIAMNWLAHLLLWMHWFNPIVWFAYFRMREDQELACDAMVLERIHPKLSTDYAMTIINLLETISRTKPTLGMATVSGTKAQLKRRIIMIKQFKSRSLGLSILGAVVVIGLSVFTLTNGVHKSDKEASTSTLTQTEKPALATDNAQATSNMQPVTQTSVTPVSEQQPVVSQNSAAPATPTSASPSQPPSQASPGTSAPTKPSPAAYQAPASVKAVEVNAKWTFHQYDHGTRVNNLPIDPLVYANDPNTGSPSFKQGASVNIKVSLLNVLDQTLTLKKSLTPAVQIYKFDGNETHLVWQGQMPTLTDPIPGKWGALTTELNWNQKDAAGKPVPTGEYYVRLAPFTVSYTADKEEGTQTYQPGLREQSVNRFTIE